jgi:hypothetical protein
MQLVRFVLLVSVASCAGADGDDGTDELDAEISSSGAWYRLVSSDGTANASIAVVNHYKVRCPDGTSAYTCDGVTLELPAACGFECRDGLLGLQGETLLRGSFAGSTLVVSDGVDSFSSGLGAYSVYRLTAAPTCAHDPCPTGVVAQKLNTTRAATPVSSVDFHYAVDPSYVLDPTRGDDQVASSAGLVASGRIVSHAFRVDRVWRAETPLAACDPQQVARAHAYLGDAGELRQFRTVAEAERFVVPEGTNAWLVRTAQTATAIEFTSGINDLWAERFSVAIADCAVTTLAEH